MSAYVGHGGPTLRVSAALLAEPGRARPRPADSMTPGASLWNSPNRRTLEG